MATASSSHISIGQWPLVAFTFVFLCYSHLEFGQCKEIPTQGVVEDWAKRIETGLMNLNIFYDIVKTQYKMSKLQDVVREDKYIKEEKLVEEMAETLSAILSKKMEALKLSVTAAETAAKAYRWKSESELQISDVHYYNSKTMIARKDIPMIYSERFGKKVNFNFSSVHIPVEIYEGSNDILNGLNWTQGLDEQFIKNKDDPDILWQYFGSQSGFMRTYPATYWNTDGVDLYDVRRQSWYTQGSSSPKDMMILIDTSGSTYGQSLQLMKNAVKSILNTLGENDFVNVVEFSETAKFVSKCFNHTAFVQANFRNKKQLERDVDKLSALGQADFSVAIRFAFEKFNEFSKNESNDENNIGANCNKVIMLLTDGGTDNAEDVFKEYNWPNKTVRVFTYAVGPTPNPIHAVRWMACANRGYFSQIPAMGAIRSRVQDYVRVLERPLAIAQVEHALWSSSHRSIYYSSDQWLGLGMMTTVTLPVYNNSIDSTNQTILGVMGVDVTTSQLEAHTPFSKIGPNGYAFAINPNGYVVFHPNLKTLGKFMKEPPNIDLLELEVEGDTPELIDLRTRMIRNDTGTKFITTYFMSPDQRYVSYGQATYAYIGIEKTTFRLGISFPFYQKVYPKFTGKINSFQWPDNEQFATLIAPWNYYKEMSKMKGLTGTLTDVIDLLKVDKDVNNWNLDLLFHLYWDVKVISTQNRAMTLVDRTGVKSVYIMTNGGMTLVYPASEGNYFQGMRDLRKSSLYTRTLYSQSCLLMADHIINPRSNSSEPPYINIACAIPIKNDTNKTIMDKPAIVGLRVSHDKIIEVMRKAAPSHVNCEDSSVVCYLIDDGGFLISTSRDDAREQIGRFFGLVDPPLMSTLNGTVFLRMVQYDFQAACKVEEDTISSGFKSFTVPTLNMVSEVLTTGFWTSKIAWAFSSFNFFSWLFSPKIEVMASGGGGSDKECVKAIQQYYVNRTYISGKSTTFVHGFSCQNCTRNFTAVYIKNMNLLFVVATPVCEECDELYPPVGQAPREISSSEEEDIICQLAQNPRKRVQAHRCYHSDSNEDQTECGCGCLRASRISLFLVVLMVVCRWMFTVL